MSCLRVVHFFVQFLVQAQRTPPSGDLWVKERVGRPNLLVVCMYVGRIAL